METTKANELAADRDGAGLSPNTQIRVSQRWVALAPTGAGNLFDRAAISRTARFPASAGLPALPDSGAWHAATTVDNNRQIPLAGCIKDVSRLVGGQIDIGAFENPDVLFHDRFE